jgi:hypothetical protein
MRPLAAPLLAVPLVLALAACTTPTPPGPREYLDEQTAATVKVVAQPLVFAQDPGAGVRDFLNVYAVDVNRMGTHQQYLAVLQWWPADGFAGATLLLEAPGQTLTLQPTTQSPRELGIAQSIDTSAPREGVWRYYPVTKDELAIVAKAGPMRASLVAGERRVSYSLWRDSRTELADLADGL